MDELRSKYERQLKEYDDLVQSSIDSQDVSKLPKLRELNAAIARTLNEMIEKLTFLRRETPTLREERDELINRLRQIQLDYNGLLVNTDNLETLRRIRQQEGSEANRQLYMYLGFFLLVVFGIIFYIMFAPHRMATTAPTASMPATTAALV
jgi:polyhydroxyalkanoate synthesis regulator phasin